MVGLDASGKSTIIEQLKVGYDTASARYSALCACLTPPSHPYVPSLFLLALAQPTKSHASEIAPTVGFHVDEFDKA